MSYSSEMAALRWKSGFASVLIAGALVFVTPAYAQELDSMEAEEAVMGPPTLLEPMWQEQFPTLTSEQKARLEYWVERGPGPGPAPVGVEAEPPGLGPDLPEVTPESQTILEEQSLLEPSTSPGFSPAAPGTARLFRNRIFGGAIPAGNKSNIMESSVAIAGKFGFYTGNWFAARSTNGGKTWQFVDPFADFPLFCCDQISIYDEARDIFLWLRQGIPSVVGGNFENEFRLGVSNDGGATFCTLIVKPTQVNPAWTNQWWDYPHIQLGADFVYIAFNVFNQAFNWTRTVVLRWPLDALRTCSSFSFFFHNITDWFTVVPVQGSYHTAYYASNWPLTAPQNNRIRIFKWPEDSSTISIVTRTIHSWTFTNRGFAQCGSASGNWAARYDQRVLSGARYTINSDGVAGGNRDPGAKILGWWWNVAQGGGFAQPYIEAAAFFEDTLTQVAAGQLGRPFVFNNDPGICFAYPSASPNKRQDLGMIFHFSSGANKNPSVGFAIADDFVGAPPPWFAFNVRTSNARPSDNAWGDYNTVREFEPTQKLWVGASHVIRRSTKNCRRCSKPVYFVFGRERDRKSWGRWKNK